MVEPVSENASPMTRNSDHKDTLEPSTANFPSEAYIRYLAAKKSVDDRALNRYVWQKLKAALPSSTRRKPLRVIELGAGIGTMFERVMEWGLAPHLHYTLVEINPDYLAAFRSRSGPKYAGCTVDAICADLSDVISDRRQDGQWDLIIAHAVMDIVNTAEVLARFAQIAKPGGLLYLSLIYDGHTEFMPAKDQEFERLIFDRYHHSMDRRIVRGRPSGGSRTGRAMFARLQALDLSLMAAGSSDWIVYPQAEGYAADEAFFLDMIIDTIDRQLQQDTTIDPHRLAVWAGRMHTRVKSAGLTFMARNMDFLARRPSP